MARISLRAYSRDIEVMIDKNQIDEAFAHCRYILALYPKHIDTYRLMGKALLEAQRFSDASDVFHRVLSSVPDDFIAHLGMSIIREDESNLDAAIWHMERSFEIQPSNAAVQVELRRLYGLRDGVTPQKIQLTRGALARMSAKSNLHSQAIAELRAALSNDPQRPDLQVVLAEMYLQTGSRIEAIETCNALITKLPYCLAANRILADVLPETERADQAQEYKSRLGELDPYYLQLSPVAPTLEQVPDGAVTIERFEYAGEALDTPEQAQPAWAASLGVDLDDEEMTSDEPAPDWLEESTPEAEAEPAVDYEAPAAALEDSELEERQAEPGESEEIEAVEDVPDWMTAEEESEEQDEPQDLPGAPAAVAAVALGSVVAGQEEEEPEPDPETEEVILKEEAAEPIPDWMAAAGLDEDELISEEPEVVEETLSTSEEELPVEEATEMASSTQEEAQEITEWMSEAEPEAEGETPDWLRDAMDSTDDEQEAVPGAAAVAAGAALLSEDDTSDTAAEIGDDTAEEIAPDLDPETEPVESLEAAGEEDEDELPDVVTAGAALAGAAAAGAVIGAALDDEADDIQTGLEDEPAEPAVESPVDESLDEGFIPPPEGEIPDWLQDLGEDLPVDEEPAEPVIYEDQPASEEPEPTPVIESGLEDPDIEEIAEILPESVIEIGEDSPAAEIDEVLIESEFPESIPDWLSEMSPEEIPEQVVGSDEELDIVKAEIPVWLQKMEAQHKSELEAAGEIDGVEELELDAEFTELSGEDVPSWLMTAMEPELPEEVDEITEPEVMDISEVIGEIEEPVDIEQLGLESPALEDIEVEQMQEEPLAQELEAEELSEALESVEDEFAEAEELEIVTPEPDFEAAVEAEEIAEETLRAEEAVEISAEGDDGISVPGLAAAGAVAAHVLDDEDTQPVAVTDEPAAAEIEPEVIEEQPVLESVEQDIETTGPSEEVLPELELEMEAEIPPESEFDEPEPSPLPADAPLTGEEEDEAMAWLESLAAKQGAAEEELLTSADERLEQPPEWIQEEASEAEPSEEEQIEVRDTALTAAALAGVTAGIIADDEEPVDEELEAEPVAEEPLEEPSEWVPEIVSEEEQLPIAEGEEASEEGEIESEAIEFDEEPDLVEELAAAAEVDLDQVEEELPTEEIPGWLSGLAEEQEVAAEAQPADWTPDMLAEEAPETEILPEATLDEKLDLNAASLAQLERIPGIGFIHAQNIVNHRASSGSFSDLEQLGDVEGLTPEMIADLENYLTIEVVPEVAAAGSELPELQDAWNSVNVGDIEQAVDKYAVLIDQDQHLDEIIRDLQAALGKYPSDSSLYQSLGDAYMHANMLQEALDAYNRAEDLF
jgi:DNA uptake protein ComE-like DNA-binding protein